MDIKQVLEELVQAEEKKLEEQEGQFEERVERDIQRFAVLKQLIEQLRDASDERYVQVSVRKSDATVQLGKHVTWDGKEHFRGGDRWRIEPATEIEFDQGMAGHKWIEKPGFEVEERRDMSGLPDCSPDIERSYVLDTEAQVIEMLAKEIAKHLAIYRRMETKSSE